MKDRNEIGQTNHRRSCRTTSQFPYCCDRDKTQVSQQSSRRYVAYKAASTRLCSVSLRVETNLAAG